MISSTCNKWIQSARQDFIVIDSITSYISISRKRPNGQILYHCQQAVEKMLKAFLVNNNINPWGHDLIALCTSCANINNSFSNKRIINHCAYLSSFNPARYPDFNTVCINAKNAERGINSAKRVFDFVCKMLGLTN